MRLAFGCEGDTWGPRVRARAVVSRLGGVALGSGPPQPPLEGYPYRPVDWLDPGVLDGFDLVVGDWSCVAMRPAGVPGIAVVIHGQPLHARHGQGRPPDDVWDAESKPLHPWAYEALPTRSDAREAVAGTLPVLAVLDQSHTPGVLYGVCLDYADRGWEIVRLNGWGQDRWIAAADLLVCPAGWAQVTQAKAARVPYVAVEQNSADHWTRAHCTLGELPTVVANLEPAYADLPDDWRPRMENHMDAFAAFCGIPIPKPLVKVESGAWT